MAQGKSQLRRSVIKHNTELHTSYIAKKMRHIRTCDSLRRYFNWSTDMTSKIDITTVKACFWVCVYCIWSVYKRKHWHIIWSTELRCVSATLDAYIYFNMLAVLWRTTHCRDSKRHIWEKWKTCNKCIKRVWHVLGISTLYVWFSWWPSGCRF